VRNNGIIGREEAVLVVIDMQEKLVPAMAEGEQAVANTRRLLGLAEVMGLPVIATEQERLGRTIPEIAEKLTGPAIPKTTFNCFLTEDFSACVAKTGRNALIICGIEAHICVAQTALSAHPRFTVHVVADAIASRSTHNVSIAVERMRSAGITITSAEMAIYELLQRAGTAEFKAMLPLVK
jgi:nicotinamidase-related amidase